MCCAEVLTYVDPRWMIVHISSQPAKPCLYGNDPSYSGNDPWSPARARFELQMVISCDSQIVTVARYVWHLITEVCRVHPPSKHVNNS